MANSEQIKILAEGPFVWNKWRRQRGIRPDLRGADLRGADLGDADFSVADLSEANLSEARLFKANLRGADLSETRFSGANLREADLRGAGLGEARLFRADLRGADLRGADLREAYLRGANLFEADLREADLVEADLLEAHLRDADLRGTDLREAFLTRADFTGALTSSGTIGLGRLSKAQRDSLRVTPDDKEVNAPPTVASLTLNREDLTELLEKLSSFVPAEDHVADTNRTPIPLTRKQHTTAIAAVQSVIAFHNVDKSDGIGDSVRRMFAVLKVILEETEALFKQFQKTVSAGARIAKLLRRMINAIEGFLKNPNDTEGGDDE